MNREESAGQLGLRSFVAIDFETATGKRSSICEIGICVVVNGEVMNQKSWFVRPKDNYYEERNIMVHHIDPECTADSPSFAEVWPEVQPYLEGRLVVAHNTAFDMYALRDALYESALPFPTFTHVCSCRLSQKLFPGLYNYRLPTVCQKIGFPMNLHHRAGVDAEASARVFMACVELSGAETLGELQNHYYFHSGYFGDGAFVPQCAKKNACIKQSEIIGDPSKIDEGNYFYDKHVCFTGKCSWGTRNELFQWVADIGGHPDKDVTKQTQVLVVGQQDYRQVGESGMSSKQRKAIDLLSKGQPIEILSESDFLDMK